jgi:1-acyl-sn-glycerol-3-phosphate acyltransferase
MKKQRNKKNLLDYYYVTFGGIVAVRLIKIWSKIHRKPNYIIEIDDFDTSKETVMASNHQSLLDPPAIFASLKLKELVKLAPVKFMTYHKYYNSIFKLPLYTTGCYPSHGPGHTGVDGGVFFAENGYRSFVFPEGKRTKLGDEYKSYPGISSILEKIPDARLLLVFINWEKRKSFWSRPGLTVVIFEAPDSVDRSDPYAIMRAIYEKGNDTLLA